MILPGKVMARVLGGTDAVPVNEDRGRVGAISMDEIENIPLEEIVFKKMSEPGGSPGSPPVSPGTEKLPAGKEDSEKSKSEGVKEDAVGETKLPDDTGDTDGIKFDPKAADLEKQAKAMNADYTRKSQANAKLKEELSSALEELRQTKTSLSQQQQQILSMLQNRPAPPQQPVYIPTDDDYLRMYEGRYGKIDPLALDEVKHAAIAIAKEGYARSQELQGLRGQLATVTANQYQSKYNELVKDFGLTGDDFKKHEFLTMSLMKTGLSMEEAIEFIPRPEKSKSVKVEEVNSTGSDKGDVVTMLKETGAWGDVQKLALAEFRNQVIEKRKTLPPTSGTGEPVSSPAPQKEEGFSLDSGVSIEDQVTERLTRELEKNLK